MTFINTRSSTLTFGQPLLAQAAPSAPGAPAVAAPSPDPADDAFLDDGAPATAPNTNNGIKVLGEIHPESDVSLLINTNDAGAFHFAPTPSGSDFADQMIRVRYTTADGAQVINLDYKDVVTTNLPEGLGLKFTMPALPGATSATAITIEIIDTGPEERVKMAQNDLRLAVGGPCESNLRPCYDFYKNLLASTVGHIGTKVAFSDGEAAANTPPPAAEPPPAEAPPAASPPAAAAEAAPAPVVAATPPAPPAPSSPAPAEPAAAAPDTAAPAATAAATAPASPTWIDNVAAWLKPDTVRAGFGIGREKNYEAQKADPSGLYWEQYKGSTNSWNGAVSAQWGHVELGLGCGAAHVSMRDTENKQNYFAGSIPGCELGLTNYLFKTSLIPGPFHLDPFGEASLSYHKGLVDNVQPLRPGGAPAPEVIDHPDRITATLFRPAIGVGARLTVLPFPNSWNTPNFRFGDVGFFVRAGYYASVDRLWVNRRGARPEDSGKSEGELTNHDVLYRNLRAFAGIEIPWPGQPKPEPAPVECVQPQPPTAPFTLETDLGGAHVGPGSRITATGGNVSPHYNEIVEIGINLVHPSGADTGYARIFIDPSHPGRGTFVLTADAGKQVDVSVVASTLTSSPSVSFVLPPAVSDGTDNFPGLNTYDWLHIVYKSNDLVLNTGEVTFEKPAMVDPAAAAPPAPTLSSISMDPPTVQPGTLVTVSGKDENGDTFQKMNEMSSVALLNGTSQISSLGSAYFSGSTTDIIQFTIPNGLTLPDNTTLTVNVADTSGRTVTGSLVFKNPQPEMTVEPGPIQISGDGGLISIRGTGFVGDVKDYTVKISYPGIVGMNSFDVPLSDIRIVSATEMTAVVPAILEGRAQGKYEMTVSHNETSAKSEIEYTSDRTAKAPQTVVIVNDGAHKKIAGFSEPNFVRGASALTASSQKNLNLSAAWIVDAIQDGRLAADDQIIVKGFTDSEGRDTTNLKLSFKRADAVRQYLITACKKAVDKFKPPLDTAAKLAAKVRIANTLFVTEGYGEFPKYLLPDAANEDPASSRRVEFEVRKEGSEVLEGGIRKIGDTPREVVVTPSSADLDIDQPAAAAPAETPAAPSAAPAAPESATGNLDGGTHSDAGPAAPAAGHPDGGSVTYE